MCVLHLKNYYPIISTNMWLSFLLAIYKRVLPPIFLLVVRVSSLLNFYRSCSKNYISQLLSFVFVWLLEKLNIFSHVYWYLNLIAEPSLPILRPFPYLYSSFSCSFVRNYWYSLDINILLIICIENTFLTLLFICLCLWHLSPY